jgi:tetratricopeptide (TPR) repeat protein
MSKYKEQRLRQIEEELRRRAERRRWFLSIAAVVTLSAGAAIWHRNANAPKANGISSRISTDEKWTLAALLALKPHQLVELDIGLTNLLCAEGLRGSENLDLDKSLNRLDEMATRVRLETGRNLYRFRSNPAEYENSEPYYRMAMLVTVLQQDFGIRYNPDRVSPVGVFEPNEKFYADSRDVFIHGLTGKTQMGTCASLPAFYTAVGRRLRYPLSLVSAKNHLFVRWEDHQTRLNIDVSGLGVNSHSDYYYRAWPYPITPKEEVEMGYLKSMTATEECAVFLSTRGHCLKAAGRYDEALLAHEKASRILPNASIYQIILDIAKREDAARNAPELPGIGMPPDPSLWDMPQETAWMLWNRDQALRQHKQMESMVPDPSPGFPSQIQPFGQKNYGLPPSSQNR